MKNAVGIIGGLGPKATVYFMELVMDMTEAAKDQEHINMLVSNHATTPDRTDFILGKSPDSPQPALLEDCMMLENAGCAFIVVTCNTAHYFHKEMQQVVGIPVLNIIEETIALARAKGAARGTDVKTVGLMATEGTVATGVYADVAKKLGIETVVPDADYQQKTTAIIYERIKAGLPVTEEDMMEVIDHLREKGAQAVIMGCTELSIAYKDLGLGIKHHDVIDSLDALARATILRAGRNIRQEMQ